MMFLNLLCFMILSGTNTVSLTIENCLLERDIISIDAILENNIHRRISFPGFNIIDGILLSPNWELQILKDNARVYIQHPIYGKMTSPARIILKPGGTMHFQLKVDCNQLIDTEWQTLANPSGEYSLCIVLIIRNKCVLRSNTAHVTYQCL